MLIVATYGVLALAYAYATPAWQNPDEPAHYNYAREIADHAALPVLTAGDYDQAGLELLKASKFAGNPDVSAIRYESYQPPLYYLIGGGLMALAPGLAQDLYVLRLLSALCGALVLVVTCAIAREVVPNDWIVPPAVTALVAFVPQHVAMTAAANNDALGELMLGLIVLLGIRRMKGAVTDRAFVVTGSILLGLALLTKVTAYAGLVILITAEIGRWHQLPSNGLRSPLVVLGGVLAGAAVISGWWFVRNAFIYGNLDILGLARHSVVVVGQPRAVWDAAGLQHFGVTLFKSFWATFGWMGVLVDERIYGLLALLTVLALLGLVFFLARRWRGLCPWQTWGLGLLALELLLIMGVIVAYNLTFLQPQGRYLFPASAAIGVFAVLGLREVIARPRLLAGCLLLGSAALSVAGGGKLFLLIGLGLAGLVVAAWRVGKRWYPGLVWVGLFVGLACLDVICLVSFIVPMLRI
jgi:hypothetical protein